MTLKLDRSEWRRVKFDEIAENVNVRVDDPKSAGVTRYVGLEHLDPGTLTVNRWGAPEQVEATKLRFRPGDVIFGRRRAYQKKVARADFEGICSAHAMVLRAKPTVVDPDFLPVFLSSDYFLERAIKISVGSLSPTVNWKTLAVQEFDLPPLDQQRRIAELLWAVEKHLAARATELQYLANALNVQREELVWRAEFGEKPLSEVTESCDYGTSERCVSEEGKTHTPVLRIPNVVSGEVTLDDLKYLQRSVPSTDSAAVSPGDLLVIRTNGNPSYVGTGAVVPNFAGVVLYASYLLRVRVDRTQLLPEFLAAAWKAPTMRSRLAPYIRSSAGNYNLSASSILSRKVPVPSLDRQKEICDSLSVTEAAAALLETEMSEAQALRDSLVAAVWKGDA